MIRKHLIRLFCFVCVLMSATMWTACIHRPHRYYDSYYNDYHRWDDREGDYYRKWSEETHRDAGRDFRKLPNDEQEEYWKWRHQHTNDKKHKHERN